MNLAAFKYRNILNDIHSPIEYITYNNYPNFRGHNYFAKLKPEFTQTNFNLKLYKDHGGTGTCFNNKFNAYNKAISEALEIWAFYALKKSSAQLQSNLKTTYGFDIDPTSNGMACFPGLFSKQTRPYALAEAIERWSLIAWWEGKLPARKANYKNTKISEPEVFELLSPWKNHTTVILKDVSQVHKKPIFSFATSNNYFAAVERAKVELFRNSRIVDKYYDFLEPPNLTSIMERRLIFFSTIEGEKLFLQKFNDSCSYLPSTPSPHLMPKLIVDTNIPGPWNRYAYVWRCLFEPASVDFLNTEDYEYFYF